MRRWRPRGAAFAQPTVYTRPWPPASGQACRIGPPAPRSRLFHARRSILASCGVNGALLVPLKTSPWETSKSEGSLEVPAQLALCAGGNRGRRPRRSHEPGGTKLLVGKDDSRRPIADPERVEGSVRAQAVLASVLQAASSHRDNRRRRAAEACLERQTPDLQLTTVAEQPYYRIRPLPHR